VKPDQERIVAAFNQGRVAGVGPVERVDTHLSHVFLARDRVYKLKRAVRLPFVDFSTLEQRRAACEAELAVNRRTAGDLYLGVLPVTISPDGAFALGGHGEIADWVVAMRRFDGDQQFDRLAAAKKLTVARIEETVSRIAAMHAEASVSKGMGHAADYRAIIRELRHTEEEGAQRLGLNSASSDLFARLDSELVRVGALIERRRIAGFVRRGHGDLHLRNICLFEGRPTLFDALEFDERLATTDVLYDFAFLLMDLKKVGLSDHANAAMNRYWDAAGEDEEALALLGFFSALRAAVRMAVAVAAGDLAEAQAYRVLALRLVDRSAPIVVAIGGLSGVGKTAVARALAARLPGPFGARILRTDVLRKQQLGLRETEKAPLETYTPPMRAKIYVALIARAKAALAHGASVIVDATFEIPESRKALDAVDRAALHAFWLTAPTSMRVARIVGRRGDASDADAAIAAAQREPKTLVEIWRRVDAGRAVEAIIEDIAKDLGARAGAAPH
jgi:aminoglycoside phosphotransferase family enzyme/cytidylate kinase